MYGLTNRKNPVSLTSILNAPVGPKFGSFQRQRFFGLGVKRWVFNLGVHKDPQVVSDMVPGSALACGFTVDHSRLDSQGLRWGRLDFLRKCSESLNHS